MAGRISWPRSMRVLQAAIWELDEDATRKVLGLLHRYSLLDYDETSSHYSLHDLLADYTLSQMDVDEEQEARLKHASYYKDILRGEQLI